MPRRVLGESRVTSFLTTISHCQVSLQHLAGKANLPSDFTSRNAPDCNEPNCQICTFVNDMEDSVVRGISIQDILDNTSSLSFFHSPQDQPGYRSKAIVQTSREFTPILNKALIRQRNLPMFVMSSAILTVLPLPNMEFLWLNAVYHLFQLLKPSLYCGPR